MGEYKYLFGPVPSRRFGRSLGVDLTPYKTCTYNCIFCQLGSTTDLTTTRHELVPMDEVLAEISNWLHTNGQADYITLSGSGEPTLNSRFGEIFDLVRKESTIPTLLLTNGSLLFHPEVRAMASKADVVKISLSAWDDQSFQKINRPDTEISFANLIHGESSFRQEFKGHLFMEVFILQGINDSVKEVKKIASVAQDIRPEKIQLNTAIRPPTETWAQPVDQEILQYLASYFNPEAEIIAEFSLSDNSGTYQVDTEMILSLLERRPCTLGDISQSFNMHINEISKYVGHLVGQKKAEVLHQNGQVYYVGKPEKGTDN